MTTALPPLLVLTDRRTAPAPLRVVVRRAVAGGARAVVLREKDLPRAERAALAEELRAELAPVGGLLLVASDPTIAADGVHLAAGDPLPTAAERPPMVGRSCHDLDDVAAAQADGCDYVTLSPILPSASKPGYGPPLGVEVLQRAVTTTAIPVVALGGVDASTVGALADAGATHVAAMGAVMRADDPGAVVAALLATLGSVPVQAGREGGR